MKLNTGHNGSPLKLAPWTIAYLAHWTAQRNQFKTGSGENLECWVEFLLREMDIPMDDVTTFTIQFSNSLAVLL